MTAGSSEEQAAPIEAQPCPLDELDDSVLIHVLECLPLPDLLTARRVCKQLWRCSEADSIWQRHTTSMFGVHLQGIQQEQVFKALKQSRVRRMLPLQAVATDKGADLPWARFWAGNMMQMTTRTMYSTQAETKDAHILCLLSNRPEAGADAAQAESAESRASREHREKLLRFCLNPAVYLLKPLALAGLVKGVLPRVTSDHLVAAKKRLEECSTQGLEDFLIYVYGRMAHGEMWGRTLIKGITRPEDIQGVHDLAWQVWHNQGPNQPLTVKSVGLPDAVEPRPVDNTRDNQVLADVAILSQLSHLLRNRNHDPRADSLSACSPTSPRPAAAVPITLGVMNEIMIDRQDKATCPVSCGVVYAVTFKPHSRSHQASALRSPTSAVRQASSSGGARDGNGHETDWREELAHVMEVSQHPWVVELSSATTAHQVMTSAALGALPPLYGYWCDQQGEWLEFCRQPARDESESVTGVTPHRCVTSLGVIDLHPVVWFRYYTRQELMTLKRQRRQAAAQAVQVTAERLVSDLIAQASELVRSESESGAPAAGGSGAAGSGSGSGSGAQPSVAAAVAVEGSGGDQLPVQQQDVQEVVEVDDEAVEDEGDDDPYQLEDLFSTLPSEGAGRHVFDLVLKWAQDNAPRRQGVLLHGLDDPGRTPPGAGSSVGAGHQAGAGAVRGGGGGGGGPSVDLPPGFREELQIQLQALTANTNVASTSSCSSGGGVDALEAIRKVLVKDPLLAALLQSCAFLDRPTLKPLAFPWAESHQEGGSGSGAGAGASPRSVRSPRLVSPSVSGGGGLEGGRGRPPSQAFLSARDELMSRASPEQLLFLSDMMNELREAAVIDCEELGLRFEGWSDVDLKRPRWAEHVTQRPGGSTSCKAPLQPPWDWPSMRRRILMSHQPGGKATPTGADSGAETAGVAAQAAGAAAAGGGAGAGGTGVERGVGQASPTAAPIKPVEVHRGMAEGPDASFFFSPPLGLAAPEISRLFGYGLGYNLQCQSQVNLHIRLHQRWAVNGMLVKLIASEDLQPEFNQDRGGCNIDVSYVTCVGEQVQLPPSTYWP